MITQQDPKTKNEQTSVLPQNVGQEISTTDVKLQKSVFLDRGNFKITARQLPYVVWGGIIAGISALAFLYFQSAKQAELRAFQDDLTNGATVVDKEFAVTKEATVSLGSAARALYDLGQRTPEAYNKLILEFVQKMPRLALAHNVGQAPFKLVPTTKWFMGYIYVDQGKKEQLGTRLPAPNNNLIYSELYKDDDYPNKEYWLIPFNSGKSSWIEPYLWYGINMTTFEHIIRDAKGEILGGAGVDMNINEMVAIAEEINTTVPSSFYSLITDKGTIVVYPPDPQKAVDRQKVEKVPELASIWGSIQKEKEGYVVDNGKIWAYRRLPTTDWLMLQSVSEISLHTQSLTQALVGGASAILVVSVIFFLYLRTLNQSISLSGLLSEQKLITEQQRSESILAEIQAEISRLQTMQELEKYLHAYLSEAQRWLNCDRILVYQFDNNFFGRFISEVAALGISSAAEYQPSGSLLSKETIESYRQESTSVSMEVLNEDFAANNADFMQRFLVKSNFVVPILLADKLYGLIIVNHCHTQYTWLENETAYIKQAGDQLGYALSGIQLATQKQNAIEEERQRSESIQRELVTLLSDVEGAASGDLTVRAQISAGEIGIVADFFNAIVESLREVVTQVKQATLQVSSSVNTNNESIRSLADEATLQAQQLDQALQSVQAMTDSIQQVSVNAKQAADASNQAAVTAETGSQAIEQSASSILQLRQTVSETAKKVKRLGEASQQISKVVVLIDQIALKTNMLAVNASIEAARAGEEGRGFAVVAQEVGALAAQSATATKEIARIVESIQQETSEVVESMEASTLQVVEGTNKVEDARRSLNQIVEVARKVNELFQGISQATVSQVQTSQSVKQVMESLSSQSQKSSLTSREVATALQETANVASKLQASVETFKVEAA